MLDPKLIICDEPVSALDVSVQAQILNLLEDMKARYGLTLVFIAHDLAVVKNVSDRVAVMYLGKICEVAAPDELYAAPAHPTRGAAVRRSRCPTRPSTAASSGLVPGDLPSPVAPPERLPVPHPLPAGPGARAPSEEPQIRRVADGHFVACHFPLVGRRGAAGATRSAAARSASPGVDSVRGPSSAPARDEAPR